MNLPPKMQKLRIVKAYVQAMDKYGPYNHQRTKSFDMLKLANIAVRNPWRIFYER